MTLWPCLIFGQTSTVDILNTEVSYWMAGPRQIGVDHLRAQSVITLEALNEVTEVVLNARGLEVETVARQEGRIKGQLTFNTSSGQLRINTHLKNGGRLTLAINYTLPLSSDEYQNYILQSESLISFNPFNTSTDIAAGKAGMFYPAVDGDPCLLRLNITINNSRNCGFPGRLDFQVDHQNGTMSQYWSSDGPIAPEAFYLVIGEFREYDAEDLEEEFELAEIALQNIQLDRSKVEMAMAVGFFGLEPEIFTDSQYAYLDSISRLDLPGFFISGDEERLQVSPEELGRRKALALYLNGSDTAKASDHLWRLTVEQNGKEWEYSVLENKWKSVSSLDSVTKRRLIRYRVQQWRSSNEALLAGISSEALDTGFVAPLLKTTNLPLVNIGYRYVAGDTALYVTYTQDTSSAPVYQIPLQVSVYSNDEVTTVNRWLRKESGELKVAFSKSPNAAGVSFGRYFPGTIEESKPDAYLLFQLGNARTATARREALAGLFKTRNPNLFSTALGIAMRDDDAGIRLLALQNAGELNIAAQRKLEDSILKLTNDPVSEVRTLAESLARKYYPYK